MRVRGAETFGRVNLSFPITFSSIASLALFALTFWYWYETRSTKETLIFFAAGAAAVGQVSASFYMARALAESLRKDDRDLRRAEEIDARETAREAVRIKQESLRFGERWNNPTMFHARDTLRTIIKKHHIANEGELRTNIEANETNVIHIVNFFEEIGTACRHGVVAYDIIKEQFDFVVVETWVVLFPWIKQQRTKNAAIYEDFEALYDACKACKGRQ